MRTRHVLAIVAMATSLAMVGISSPAAASTVPGPPLDVHGVWTSSDGERTFVDWNPPVSDGGVMLLGYGLRATKDNGNTWIDLGWNDECTPQEPACVPVSDKVVSYTLMPFMTYRLQARALNENGWGAWSALGPAFTANPGGRLRPSPPRDVTAIAGDRAILLRWSAPADPYGLPINFQIEWTLTGGTYAAAHTAWTRAHSYVISGLDATKSWQIRIKTVRSEAESSWWRTISGIQMAKNPQRIIQYAGFPSAVARSGRTRILPCGVQTNRGHTVRAYIDWTGIAGLSVDDNAVVVKRSACGGVTIVTTGQPVRIRVALWATPAPPQEGLLKVRIYRTLDRSK